MGSLGNLSSMVLLPTERMLQDWSYLVSLTKSTNKLKVDDLIVETVVKDCAGYSLFINGFNDIRNYEFRVKTSQSVRNKFERRGGDFQSVFNDILGLRLKVKNYYYYIKYPSYYRVVDMTNGKANDDGYRAVHLYYKLDNLHYLIEIQLWSDDDYNFNYWSHANAYKLVKPDILLELRRKYDAGIICTELDFRKELSLFEYPIIG